MPLPRQAIVPLQGGLASLQSGRPLAPLLCRYSVTWRPLARQSQEEQLPASWSCQDLATGRGQGLATLGETRLESQEAELSVSQNQTYASFDLDVDAAVNR